MMKQLFFPIFVSFLLLFSVPSRAQIPGMTDWVSDSDNGTEIRYRMHDRSINNGYALCEVEFSMSAARCALTTEVSIAIYENDGSGSYGTQRYSTTFDPGPGTVGISTGEMTRIQIVSIGSTEPLYARVKVVGVLPADDFEIFTPNCITSIVSSDAYDPNELYTTASAIPGEVTHTGLVVNTDADFYELTITSAERLLNVSMDYLNDYRTSVSNLDLDLFLMGSTGSTLTSSTSSATSSSTPITESINEILVPGTYYICVRPKSTDPNRNFYDLTWETMAAPDPEIGGLVRDNFNHDVLGVAMTGLPGTPITDVQGRYSTTVESGWNGTVTPELEGYTFDPSSRLYSDLTSDHTFENYVAYNIYYLLSGTIEISPGTPLSGVNMSGFPGLLNTDVDGNYSRNMLYGWSGTVTPTLEGYSFTPSSTTYTSLSADQVVNYTATLNTYQIEGYVETGGGTGISGVSMSGLPGEPLTDVDGYYTAFVDHDWSGTVTPALEGYTFDPSSAIYSNVSEDQNQDYTAILNTYQIDGYVRTGEGTGISGVNMSGLPGEPLTDVDGYYMAEVEFGVNTTVTPALDGYTFSPTSTDYSPVEDDETTDYTGTRDPYLTVSESMLSLGQEAGSNSMVDISSNVDWSVICPETWITFSQESGTGDASLTVTANSENISTESRSAMVTVTDGVLSRNFSVTQSGSGPFLETSALELSLASLSGASGSIAIVSNIAWSASEAVDWLSVTPLSGSNDGNITISALSENTMVESRSAMVTVTGGGISHAIEVTQSGSTARLEVSPLTAAINSEAGSYINVNISSNVDWNVSKDMWWLLVSPSFGSGDGVVTLLADQANPDTTERIAIITIAGDTMVRQIVLTQAGAAPEPTGMNNPHEEFSLTVYPNPPQADRVFVKTNILLDSEVLLKLMDITGKILYETQLPCLLPGEPVELDLTGFPRGPYLIHIRNSGVQQVFKIMKYK